MERKIELDEDQASAVHAIAKRNHVPVRDLVRQAVAVLIERSASLPARQLTTLALRHPKRDHSAFGAWRHKGLDGVAYQKKMREE